MVSLQNRSCINNAHSKLLLIYFCLEVKRIFEKALAHSDAGLIGMKVLVTHAQAWYPGVLQGTT